MNFIIVKNNNESSKGFGKFYARACYNGFLTTEDVADEIQRNCTVKHSDVLAVVKELQEVINRKIIEGWKVKLDGFGIFKVGLSTAPADSPEDFTVQKNIKGAHVLFQPSTKKDSATGERENKLLRGLRISEAPKNIY